MTLEEENQNLKNELAAVLFNITLREDRESRTILNILLIIAAVVVVFKGF